MSVQNNNEKPNPEKSGSGMFMRIFAIFGIILILGLYVLSFVASVSNWENSFGIFTGALGATIFVPIVIYLIKFFTSRNKE